MTAKAWGWRHQVRSVLLTITLIVPGFAFAHSTLPFGPVGHRQPTVDVPSSDESLRDNFKIGASNAPFGPALKALPKLNIKATCRRAQPLRGQESAHQGCINDKTDAQRELSRTWFDFKPGSRSTCTRETQIGGSPSYVELLACLKLDKEAVEAQIENKKHLNVPQTPR